MNKIIITLIMLLTSISFSEVNTMYHDGTDCNCDSITTTDDTLSGEAPGFRWVETGIVMETPYVNDKINGIIKWYSSKEGSLRIETPYVNNKMNGIRKEYFDDGSIKWETPYVNDKMNGVEKEYDTQGNLISSAKYKNDVLDGYKHCSDGRIGNESLSCRN